MPKFVVYYSYDLKDREDNYMAGDKNTFIIEADDRRLIDGKEIIAKIRRIAQDHCKKGWIVTYANYYRIEEAVTTDDLKGKRKETKAKRPEDKT